MKPTSPTRTYVHASAIHLLTSPSAAFRTSHNSPLQCLAREIPNICIPILFQCPEHRDDLGLDQLLTLFPALRGVVEE